MADPQNPFAALTARQIMHADPICASPQESLQQLRQRLVSAHVSGMPVVERGRLVGVISRSDIARVESLLESLEGAVAEQSSWQDQQADGFSHAAPPPAGLPGNLQERLAKMRVGEAMRRQVITCRPDAAVPDIARQMLEHHVHRIIVVEDDRPVGVVSALDLARLVAGG